MTGADQSDFWRGRVDSNQEHVVVENHHDPGTLYAQTLVTDRHKLTVYQQHDYGDLSDLEVDPGEVENRWNDPAAQEVKSELLLELCQAKMDGESLPMPRIAGITVINPHLLSSRRVAW
jgi:uncharacterized sulfatase